MITLDLDKADLVNLICGRGFPTYEVMFEYVHRKLADYVGGFADRGEWDRNALMKCSEEELLEIYKDVKLK